MSHTPQSYGAGYSDLGVHADLSRCPLDLILINDLFFGLEKRKCQWRGWDNWTKDCDAFPCNKINRSDGASTGSLTPIKLSTHVIFSYEYGVATYQSIYPSAPLLRSQDTVRPRAADLMNVEYFEAEPDKMPIKIFTQHHVLINLKPEPHRVENWRDGEPRLSIIRKKTAASFRNM